MGFKKIVLNNYTDRDEKEIQFANLDVDQANKLLQSQNKGTVEFSDSKHLPAVEREFWTDNLSTKTNNLLKSKKNRDRLFVGRARILVRLLWKNRWRLTINSYTAMIQVDVKWSDSRTSAIQTYSV